MRAVWCRKDECPYSGRCAGRHRYSDLLLSAFFQSGDSTLFAEAASAAPARRESCGPDEFHTALPRKSATRFECAAAGRRTSQRASRHIVSFLSVGRPSCGARSAMVGRHPDLRHRGVALRPGAETGGACGALEAFGHRRFHLANRDAVSRSHRPRTRVDERLRDRSFHASASAQSTPLKRRGTGNAASNR